SIVADPASRITDLSMLTFPEERQLLEVFNDTSKEYPGEGTILELFREQVVESPENTALVLDGKGLSYSEVDLCSSKLAHYLQSEHGVFPGDYIGLLVDRSPWAIISMLGIMKCGGVYVPIDKGYPEERKSLILEDAGARLLVTDSVQGAGSLPTAVLPLDIVGSYDAIMSFSPKYSPVALSWSSPVYVMYTSGTTGRPKGVQVTHRNIVKLAKEEGPIAILPTDRVLQWSNLAFDGSTYDIYSTL
ncbi:AMP-binding protein, partial [Maribacter sp. 2-571]|uniref:AMP-binding protein n=1 Tax=Maribacter sp. 2-571 TaxID=3417569 RepID=UPI003D348A64